MSELDNRVQKFLDPRMTSALSALCHIQSLYTEGRLDLAQQHFTCAKEPICELESTMGSLSQSYWGSGGGGGIR